MLYEIGDFKLYNYKKSIVVCSPDEIGIKYRQRFVDLGGIYNGSLDGELIGIDKKKFKGYLFKPEPKDDLIEMCNDINDGKIKPKGKGKILISMLDKISETLNCENELQTEIIQDPKKLKVVAYGPSEEVENLLDEKCDLLINFEDSHHKIVFFSKPHPS